LALDPMGCTSRYRPPQVSRFLKTGKGKGLLGHAFPLNRWKEAFDLAEQGMAGKILRTPSKPVVLSDGFVALKDFQDRGSTAQDVIFYLFSGVQNGYEKYDEGNKERDAAQKCQDVLILYPGGDEKNAHIKKSPHPAN